MLRADSDFKIVDKTHQTEQTKQTNEQMEDKTMKETEGLPLPIYIRSDNVQTKTAPIFQAMTLEKGQVVAKEETTLPTLFFMLTGNLKTIPMALWPAERDLPGRCLFLIPSGESFYGKATEPTTLLCCMFHRYYVHLDPAPQTDSANQPDTLKDNVPAVLPLLPALRHEAGALLAELRTLLHLNSAKFTVEADAEEIRFTVSGYGHRVGMSQYGADYMARQGADYKEILAHYYPGTTLT